MPTPMLSQLLDALGPSPLRLITDQASAGVPVSGVLIHEPRSALPAVPHGVLFAVGTRPASADAAELAAAVAESSRRYARPEDSGTPLLGVPLPQISHSNSGELDLRALFKQFGERRAADDLAAAWQGGRYVAFRKTGDASAAPSLADLALVYVSRWKSAQAAGRFAKLYADSVAQRYLNAAPDTAAACTGSQCPVASGRFSTETGPVIIEQWADNTVLVSESFDSATAARLLNAVRDEAGDAHADNFQSDELGLRLMEAPGFSAFQDSLGDEVRDQLAAAANP